jgi:ribonuclease P protein component
VPVTNTLVGEAGEQPESPSQSQGCLFPDLSFGKQNRLLCPRDFKAVFDGAVYKASNRHLLLLAIPSKSTRLGLVVAKKHARHAVQRNRLKRLLRESFRHHLVALKDLDIVALVKPGLWQQDNTAICKIINAQWQYLLKQKNNASTPATRGNQSINRPKTP